MKSRKRLSCWEIMHCDDSVLCPMRKNGSTCWEWMKENNGFQCRYGMCQDCIVYLYNNDNTVLSHEEVEEVLKKRKLCHLEK